MKVLFDHSLPFALAHGGFQIQIEQTRDALEKRGVEVEYLRWWDEKQTGQVVHYFGRPGGDYIDLSHKKGRKVVTAELLTGMGARSASGLRAQKAMMRVAKSTVPVTFLAKMGWDTYRKSDAFVALTSLEAGLMCRMFDADPAKVHVVPNGVEEVFFRSALRLERKATEDYLVCTATIHPRKRILELAEAAALAKIPIWIIGRPYDESEAYFQRFLAVQKANPSIIRYEGGVSDRKRLAGIYLRARGFVLLSAMESLSLSALEAAASGCPLLLSDLPWARTAFAEHASFADGAATAEKLAPHLRAFYEKAATEVQSLTPLTWDQVAAQLEAIYSKL